MLAKGSWEVGDSRVWSSLLVIVSWWGRICKPFKELRNQFQARRNRFLGSLTVYKDGLWNHTVSIRLQIGQYDNKLIENQHEMLAFLILHIPVRCAGIATNKMYRTLHSKMNTLCDCVTSVRIITWQLNAKLLAAICSYLHIPGDDIKVQLYFLPMHCWLFDTGGIKSPNYTQHK